MKKNQSQAANLTSSFAHKYGISSKQNSLGLNPNLNIEDQYIENLLKQIHFMNLQIKLVKQKQSQSDTNALWGLVNRSNMPMSTNIVQSSQKYQRMKKQADSHLHKLQIDIARLENNQGALTTQINFLDKKQAQIAQKTKNWENDTASKHKVLNEKISNSQKKLANILQQLQKQKKKNKQLKEANSKYTLLDQAQKQKQNKQALQIQNDQIIQQRVQSQLVGQIALLKLLSANLQKKFDENLEYIKAKQEQKILRQKLEKLEKDIASANFETMQLNDAIKMAEMQKDQQIKERKKLTEQYEQKKVMLAEISLLNAVRIEKQTEARKKQSLEIIKAEQQRTKLQKNLDEIKKKLLKNQEANSITKNQVANIEREITNVKQENNRLKENLAKLKQSNGKIEQQLIKTNLQLIKMDDTYEKTMNQSTNKSLDLFEIQRQLQYFRGRRELLNKSINLKDVINGLGIEDLQRVVQKNNDLNSTVSALMTKWEQIKDFSRI